MAYEETDRGRSVSSKSGLVENEVRSESGAVTPAFPDDFSVLSIV